MIQYWGRKIVICQLNINNTQFFFKINTFIIESNWKSINMAEYIF